MFETVDRMRSEISSMSTDFPSNKKYFEDPTFSDILLEKENRKNILKQWSGSVL